MLVAWVGVLLAAWDTAAKGGEPQRVLWWLARSADRRPDVEMVKGEIMKKKVAWCSATAFAVALVVGVLAGMADANPWGRPSGWHYNLELIAVPKEKTVSG